ncbi:MAG: PQQ-like beta-propeller repeat protein [Vicinamibacterales bacterium]|nr:PQQ-like beta-propeller repeat protein [Vicinamibacterales bacterium]MDP7478824.1 PQQ-like beta-propeller repeat protein [Vicinamibacterales bacterium]HJN45126.1 PQQ-binding-like beta-propeller repeat protein [Vicinamibacterales bacterium]
MRSTKQGLKRGTWDGWPARVALMVALGVMTLSPIAHAQDPSDYATAGEWRQFGGPTRDFQVEAPSLANAWPEGGPTRLWSRPLGPGHSSVIVDDGRLYTMFRPQVEGARWASEETVIALDAATGEMVWDYSYPSRPMDFNFGAGPHSSPLVVGDRLFTVGTNKQFHVFDKRSGELLWSHDLVADFNAPPTLIRPAVKAGYGASPTAYKDMVIVTAGGPGQSVLAFRQEDGSLVWRGGDFLISPATPMLIDVDGQTQLLVYGGQTINGLDPDTGTVLWTHEHETQGDMNNSTPVWGDDNILFMTSNYNGGGRAVQLSRDGAETRVEELWFNTRLAVMFGNVLRLGDYLYGSSGGFGPAIVTALDVKTGEAVWQQRGYGRSSFVHADGKAIMLSEDGRLVLARLSPEGFEVLSSVALLDTTAWTAPTLVGTTLYVRDRAQIVALDVGE